MSPQAANFGPEDKRNLLQPNNLRTLRPSSQI
jgi:hypothetical protein